jgi:hypothetical protein
MAAMWLVAAILATVTAAGPCESIDVGRERLDLARAFTPLSAPPGTYLVKTTEQAIVGLAAKLKACDPSPAPGAWEVTKPEAHEAFGQAGIYDRLQLAQLFGGKRLEVVRGSLPRGDGIDAYTLISPYPDAQLSSITPGTLVIVLHVPRP